MADVSAHTPIFSRGSAVLDYWLVHAEGLTIQPLGARVEEVVVTAPVGHAESLIVRSRRTRRRKAIPAASIVSVEPSTGELLMDARQDVGSRLRAPRLSPERIASARVNAGRGRRFVRAHAGNAMRLTRTGAVAAFSWLRPRAVQVGKTTARHTQLAAVQTANGVVWLTPRVATRARTTGATAARLTLAVAVIVARGLARTARELERATALIADRGRASLEARRARRDNVS